MCTLCSPSADQGTAGRAHILRLLALLEQPDALPPDLALRLGQHLLDALGATPRCESVEPERRTAA